MNVIERIKKMRDDRNWSDYKLADEAMIPPSTLASIYSRNTPPKLDILESICTAFGITLAQFFMEDEQSEIVSEQEKLLIEQYRKLPDKKKKAVLALLSD